MPLFHGVSTAYIDSVPRSVTIVESSIIFLVGTAPTFKVAAADVVLNDPVRVINDVEDARYFGAVTQGFTIPSSLDNIRDQGGGLVEVCNVFDAATHKTVAQAISYTFPTTGAMADKIQLQWVTGTAPAQVVTANTTAQGLTGTFTVTGNAGTPTYVLNTDYTIDMVTGILTRKVGGAITSGLTVKVTYTYADPGKVVAADIIGTVTGNNRTGLQAALEVYPLRGYRPKIIIVPGFSELATVATEMGVIANKLGAYYILDAALAATRDEAVAGRAGTAPVANFGTASRRAILCYPRLIDSDLSLQPYSAYLAGVIQRVDAEQGYWWSPSNKEIRGVVGMEVRLTADFTDANTDMNVLNGAGVTSVYNNFGTGFLSWGNRSAAYPTDTSPLNFICVGRNLDITLESAQRACLPFVDRPINNALIDTIEATLNGFVRSRVIAGALLEGSEFFYNPDLNPPLDIAAGKITFSYRLGMPTPAEHIVLSGIIDINLYNQLGREAV